MKRTILKLIEAYATPRFYIWIIDVLNKFSSKKREINILLLLKLIQNRTKDLFFIQIGANDGVKNDPLFGFIKSFHWRGVLVEPIPEMFDKLKNNYKGESQLIFENVGIGDQEGQLDFYYLPKEYNDPDWLQQIGTFDKKAIELNLASLPQFLDNVVVQKINVISLQSLVQRNSVKKIDLLTIDAEGYEYRILSHLESLTVKPTYLLFEWGCLDAESFQKLKDLLIKEDYSLHFCGGDVIAIKGN